MAEMGVMTWVLVGFAVVVLYCLLGARRTESSSGQGSLAVILVVALLVFMYFSNIYGG
jgi:hypothetical protein